VIIHKTIYIEGLGCGHCVAWITTAIEQVNGVTGVAASLGEKNVNVTFDDAITNQESIASVIENGGYHVVGIS
jgi:copper chaperone CopZ